MMGFQHFVELSTILHLELSQRRHRFISVEQNDGVNCVVCQEQNDTVILVKPLMASQYFI